MKKTIFFVGIIIALILAITSDFISDGKIFGKCSIKTQVQKQLLKNEIKKISEKYKGKNAVLLQKFEQKLAKTGRKHFLVAKNNVDQTVKEMTSYKNCAILCGKMVQDKIKKTQVTQEFIRNLTGPRILVPCQKGHAEINNLLLDFHHKIQENNNQYCAELAQIAEESKSDKQNKKSLNNFINDNIKFQEKAEVLAMAKIAAAASGILEIVFIRGTVKIIVRCCGHIISKLAATGTAAATAAVIDGPVPVGDIIGAGIAVVGVAWTAYDLYKVHVTMPREMRTALYSMLKQYENGCRQEALRTAQKTVREFDKTTQNIINSL